MKIFFIYLSILITLSSYLFAIKSSQVSIIEKTDKKVRILISNENNILEQTDGLIHFPNNTISTIDIGLPELPKLSFSYGTNPEKEYSISYIINDSYTIKYIEKISIYFKKKILEFNLNNDMIAWNLRNIIQIIL